MAVCPVAPMNDVPMMNALLRNCALRLAVRCCHPSISHPSNRTTGQRSIRTRLEGCLSMAGTDGRMTVCPVAPMNDAPMISPICHCAPSEYFGVNSLMLARRGRANQSQNKYVTNQVAALRLAVVMDDWRIFTNSWHSPQRAAASALSGCSVLTHWSQKHVSSASLSATDNL